MIKQILVSVIALSMTLLTACGKASNLAQINSTEIPVKFEEPVAESKPWISEFTGKRLAAKCIVGLVFVGSV